MSKFLVVAFYKFVALPNYQEMQDRINSMAMVHEQLYGSKDFSTIRVIDYTNMLVDS